MHCDQKYDIFISYRRATGANAARMMQQALTARGYSAFFDFDSFEDRRFDEAIYSVIDSCEVFILMMTGEPLDWCANEDDRSCIEMRRALEKGKYIVPVAPSGKAWSFPNRMPWRALRNLRVFTLDMNESFEMSVESLIAKVFPLELHNARAHRTDDEVTVDIDDLPVSIKRDEESVGYAEPMERKRIFISYSRMDLAFAESFAKRIEDEVHTVPWFDLQGIETGAQFEDVIIRAIDNCDLVLFLFSENSLNSPWTKKEVMYAKNIRKKIYPVVIDGTALHGWFLFEFGDINYIDYSKCEHVEKLFRDLRGCLKNIDELRNGGVGAYRMNSALQHDDLIVESRNMSEEDWKGYVRDHVCRAQKMIMTASEADREKRLMSTLAMTCTCGLPRDAVCLGPNEVKRDVQKWLKEEGLTGALRPGGLLFERFRILEVVGHGGCGVVATAGDEKGNNEIVALKISPPDSVFTENSRAYLNVLYRCISRLGDDMLLCPQCVSFDAVSGLTYAVMKYVKGVTLTEFVDVQPDAFVRLLCLHVIGKLAMSLDKMHGEGIMHCDVKPDNVLVGLDGGVYIVDFSSARRPEDISAKGEGISPGKFYGTLAYLAPELWRGKLCSAASDQYSLAVTAYRILFGHTPFRGSEVEIRNGTLYESVELPSAANLEMCKVFGKGLAKDPANRYPSCQAFVRDLMRSVSASPLV